MQEENLAALLQPMTSLVVLALSWWMRSDLPVTRNVAKPLGELIFLLAMGLFIWATAALKRSFLGTVQPVSDQLVMHGPYRWVRHPLYLSMIISLLGLAIALRSLWGIAATLGLFAPSTVYRARLEERALAHKFGAEWESYVRRTHFILPWLWQWQTGREP